GSDSVPVDVAKIASHDLETTGLFEVFSRDQMLGTPHAPDDVNYDNWRTLGADNLVVGNIQGSEGGYKIHFDILNVYTSRSIAGFEVSADKSGMRDAAHAVANLIYQQLTGEQGYFLSRIAYVTVTSDNDTQHYRLVVADYDGRNPA